MLTAAELTALGLSLRIGVAAVLMALPFALAAAWLIVRKRFPGRTLFDALVHLPKVLPPVAVGFLLLMLLGVRSPIGAFFNDTLGIRFVFSAWGAAIAAAVMSFPLMVRSIRLSLEAVDSGLEAAARTLGARPLDVFTSITLPLIAPGILSGALLGFAAALGEFGATITFASNVEGVTQTLPLAIYSALQQPDGDAAALRLVVISIVLALVAVALAELADRWLRRRLGRDDGASGAGLGRT